MEEQSGAVREIIGPNVFVELDEGGTLRIDPKDLRGHLLKEDQRVVVQRREGSPQSFNGGPNADLVRILSPSE